MKRVNLKIMLWWWFFLHGMPSSGLSLFVSLPILADLLCHFPPFFFGLSISLTIFQFVLSCFTLSKYFSHRYDWCVLLKESGKIVATDGAAVIYQNYALITDLSHVINVGPKSNYRQAMKETRMTSGKIDLNQISG